jgi:hypothetical protein
LLTSYALLSRPCPGAAVPLRAPKRSYRLWPALDSILHGGLPRGVRAQAKAAGLPLELDVVVDVQEARDSRVMVAKGLLDVADLDLVEAVRAGLMREETVLQNNPQNATHVGKQCTFLNNPPQRRADTQLEGVLGKMREFAQRGWDEAGWGEPGEEGAAGGGGGALPAGGWGRRAGARAEAAGPAARGDGRRGLAVHQGGGALAVPRGRRARG